MSDHATADRIGAADTIGADRLILLRHGRTEWNATGRFQGQADIALDELGRRQAEQAAEVLSAEPIDEVWSSDLSRALATATTVADRLGLPVRTSEQLREIHVGSWEGLTIDDLHRVEPDVARRFAGGEDVRRSASGETTAETGRRVAAELQRIVGQAPDDATVLIGIHGLAALSATGVLLGLPYEHWRALGSLINCHWVDLRRQRHAAGSWAGRWRLHAWNVGAPGAVDGEQPVRAIDTRTVS